MPAPIHAQDFSSLPAPSAFRWRDLRHSPSRWLVPLLLLLLASAFLYRTPYSASALEIVPDSVEYAVGAQRIALLGRYDIEINHVVYPARYAPWFSLLLSPVYRLTHGAMGSGILIVLAFGLAGVLALHAIGCRVGTAQGVMRAEWGGAGAVLCLLSFKEYRMLTRYVMTDTPAAALGLICCALYLRIQGRSRRRDYVLAGLLSGLASALRYEGFVLLLPFLALAIKNARTGAQRETNLAQGAEEAKGAAGTKEMEAGTITGSDQPRRVSLLPARMLAQLKGTWQNVVLLCAPTLLITVATFVYNARVFGSWRRSGYHYWNAVPYDYTFLVWSPRYVTHNLSVLAAKQSVLMMALGLIGVLLLRRRPNPALNAVFRFIGWACVPAGIAHLFYFSSDVRFYVLLLTLWGGVGGVGLASLLPVALTRSPRWLIGGLAAALLFAPIIRRSFDSEPARRVDADALARLTPANAVIVTTLDPVYLEPFVLRVTRRRMVPLTRDVEYASKAVVSRRIAHPVPPPRDAQDARAPGMLAGGARDIFAYTADEAPEKILALARTGVPVYVDLRFAPNGLNVPALFRGAEGAEIRWTDVPGCSWLKRLQVAPIASPARNLYR